MLPTIFFESKSDDLPTRCIPWERGNIWVELYLWYALLLSGSTSILTTIYGFLYYKEDSKKFDEQVLNKKKVQKEIEHQKYLLKLLEDEKNLKEYKEKLNNG